MKTFIDRRRNSFFPSGFTDFLHEVYLCMSFGVCINGSQLEFDSIGTAINNLFAMFCGSMLVVGPIAIAINVGTQW